MTTLAKWLERQNKGAFSRLHHETRLNYPTLYRVLHGKPVRYATAKKIHEATSGAVDILPMCEGARSLH